MTPLPPPPPSLDHSLWMRPCRPVTRAGALAVTGVKRAAPSSRLTHNNDLGDPSLRAALHPAHVAAGGVGRRVDQRQLAAPAAGRVVVDAVSGAVRHRVARRDGRHAAVTPDLLPEEPLAEADGTAEGCALTNVHHPVVDGACRCTQHIFLIYLIMKISWGAVALTVGSVPRIGSLLNNVNLIDCSFSTTNENGVI